MVLFGASFTYPKSSICRFIADKLDGINTVVVDVLVVWCQIHSAVAVCITSVAVGLCAIDIL